jgi:hypothetical protein
MNRIVLASLCVVSSGLLNFSSTYAQCTPTGATAPTAAASVFVAGPPAWSNTNGALTKGDANYSVAGGLLSLGSFSPTQPLKVSGFGFTLPPTATICGITATVTHLGASILSVGTALDPATTINDQAVHLVSGAITSANNKASATGWTATPTDAVYGGPTDTWGTSWTPTLINDPSFGLTITAQIESGSILSLLPGAYIDGITINISYNPTGMLPITLEAWNAVRQGSSNILSWQASVTDLPGKFVVQRSPNGVDWSDYADVAAPLTQSNYNFTDDQPFANGPTYYRLELVSPGETTTYSSVQVISSGAQLANVRFYPNPFTDMINIASPHSFTRLSLKDIQGKTLWVKEYGGGVTNVQIPASGLAAGIYFVQVDGSTYKLVKR